MLWLWLVSALVGQCVCSGVHPGGPLISVEAHGPLARQALLSSGGGGGFPFYGRRDHPFATVDHRTRTVADYAIRPVFRAAEPKYTIAKLQVSRPVIQKQCHDVPNNVAIKVDRPIHNGLAAPSAESPEKSVSPSLYRPAYPAYAHPANSYPLVSYYYPFQVPVQAYPPAFIGPPQGVLQVEVPQQTPVYPQRPVSAVRPPPQYPGYPQQPVYAPPPGPTPAYPPAPQEPAARPPDEEFDYSDAVVIENPDLERAAAREGQPEAAAEPVTGSFQGDKKACDEEEEAKRIVGEFQNRQLLRLLIEQLRGVRPSQIQTLRELEGLGRRLEAADGERERIIDQSPKEEGRLYVGNQEVQYFARDPTSDREIVSPTLKTTLTDRKGAGQTQNFPHTLVEVLPADE